MKNILIPIDGSEYSMRAIKTGREFAKMFNSNVTLLNVVHTNFPIVAAAPAGVSFEDINRLYDETRIKSLELLKAARELLVDIKNVETINLIGNPANTIIDFSESKDVDLIIMGTHGLDAVISRLVMGSTTAKVLHHTQKSVLVVK